ncbi:alpha/beta fold hydrolase [Dactylosporangium sp. NPDC050688]|uniref:thioesterase II family protein n=1 Tax=Dactylosporangium sp. NPDC050688 TaxID=3157217 RepID=UPI0033FFF860
MTGDRSAPEHTTWVPLRGGGPRPALRVFCLPHAGGAASAFRAWTTGLPAGSGDVEVCAVQLPGREGRFGEPAAGDLAGLAAPLGRALLPLLDVPFALVGNSMGALVAFELAHHLQRRYLLPPVRLVAAAAHPPGARPPGPDLAGLDDDAFVTLLQRRYGGIPEEILDQPEILRAYLPVLRADLTMLEAYRPAPGRPPLRCPVTAFVGDQDRSLDLGRAEGWRSSAAAFDGHTLPGGHFALLAHRDAVLDRLRAEAGLRSPAAVS